MIALHRGLWYMGGKSRVLEGPLSRAIEEEAPSGSTVVDLMSGSGVVAAYCANGRRTFANDVEPYAWMIARSLIEHDEESKGEFLRRVDPRRDLSEAYERNFEELSRYYREPLRVEDRLLERFAAGERGARWCAEYRRFLEEPGSVYGAPPLDGARLYAAAAPLLREESVRRYREDPRREPACLATAYYANVYFGLRQAIAIDSIACAIGAPGRGHTLRERKRVHYLSALLHAASFSTSGTSHFAQPRHLSKDSELLAMARRRTADIFSRFEECSRDLLETVRRTTYVPGNEAFCSEYRAFLEPAEAGDGRSPRTPAFRFPAEVDLVYFDPPYTADHYSRFYHVLDVLVEYDYPPLERDRSGGVVRGRYPAIERRFQSAFAKRRSVEGEFRTVIRASAAAGAKLIVSYASPTGLLLEEYAKRHPGTDPVRLLEALCREAYDEVATEREPVLHSGQGDKNREVEELVIICKKPRVEPRLVARRPSARGPRQSRKRAW